MVSFLILTVLRPFNLSDYNLDVLILWSTGISGLVGGVVLIVGGVSTRVLRKSVLEKWTVGKEIVLITTVLIAISLILFGFFLSQNPEIEWKDLFIDVVVRTLAISIMPVLVMVLFEQHRFQVEKRRQAEQINAELLKRNQEKDESLQSRIQKSKLQLHGENEKVVLSVFPEDLICFKSDGNYVEVFHKWNGQTRKELIRTSLKAIESQIPTSPFFRCHQRFIINLDHISKVDGNARNLLVFLDGLDDRVPVSRSKSKDILEKFQVRTN